MTSPQLARMASSTRKESDVALGRLMAALDDAETEMTLAVQAGMHEVKYASLVCAEMAKIILAKQRYDAARLAEGGPVPVLPFAMVETTDVLDDGRGGYGA